MKQDSIQIAALILAGGMGIRMSKERPKQFLEIGGKPVIAYTMEAFEQHTDIEILAVVCRPEWIDYVKETATQCRITKLKTCLEGGENSFESLCHGIEGLLAIGCNRDTIVLVHDAVRPFVSQQIITGNIETCRRWGNAVTALRSEEAFAYSSDGHFSQKYQSRENLYSIQTPHTFKLGDIADACRQAKADGYIPQSLYTMMAEQGKNIYMASGEIGNFKLTYSEDVAFCRAIIEKRLLD